MSQAQTLPAPAVSRRPQAITGLVAALAASGLLAVALIQGGDDVQRDATSVQPTAAYSARPDESSVAKAIDTQPGKPSAAYSARPSESDVANAIAR